MSSPARGPLLALVSLTLASGCAVGPIHDRLVESNWRSARTATLRASPYVGERFEQIAIREGDGHMIVPDEDEVSSADPFTGVVGALAEAIEPENLSGYAPPPPHSAVVAALNFVETAAVRMGLLRSPFKTYTAWVEPGVLMRGSQQDQGGLAALRDLGIRTVVNLRLEDFAESPLVAALGMTPVSLPFYDQSLPTRAEVRAFLALLADPARCPVYVHCMQGVGRTGIMVAAARLARDHFSADQAIDEARRLGMVSAAQEAFIRLLEVDLRAGRLR